MPNSEDALRQDADLVAVIVLYRMRAEDSPAFHSLTQLTSTARPSGRRVKVVLCDNSPTEQAVPAKYVGPYLRSPSNPGLARCYNQALEIAEGNGAPWLLLLDQDTTVTAPYLDEVLSALDRISTEPDVAAIVPRLAHGGIVCSPMVHRRYGPDRAIDNGKSGIARDAIRALNSGAVVRVSAIRAIGGFPEDFPLDYLDHATFTELQRSGGRLYVLAATLDHHLSSNDESRVDEAAVRRQESVLDAEYRFYNRYGTAGDRLRRRFKLLRACAGRLLRGKDGGQTWRMLKSAIRR